MTAPGENQDALPSALRHPGSHARLWIIAGSSLAFDLWSKHWVFEQLDPDEFRTIIAKTLCFQRTLNAGAVFGSFAGFSGLFIVATLFALAFVMFIFAGCRPRQRSVHIALGLILGGALGNLYDRAYIKADVLTINQTSGAQYKRIGTVIETGAEGVRIGTWPDGANSQLISKGDIAKHTRQGVVRDFIKFVPRFPSWVPGLGGRDVWPWVFNVADSALVVGVGVLLVNFWFERRHVAVESAS